MCIRDSPYRVPGAAQRGRAGPGRGVRGRARHRAGGRRRRLLHQRRRQHPLDPGRGARQDARRRGQHAGDLRAAHGRPARGTGRGPGGRGAGRPGRAAGRRRGLGSAAPDGCARAGPRRRHRPVLHVRAAHPARGHRPHGSGRHPPGRAGPARRAALPPRPGGAGPAHGARRQRGRRRARARGPLRRRRRAGRAGRGRGPARPGRGRHGPVRVAHLPRGGGPPPDRAAPPRRRRRLLAHPGAGPGRRVEADPRGPRPGSGPAEHLAAPVDARPGRRGGHPGAGGGTARVAGDAQRRGACARRPGRGPGARCHGHRGHRTHPGAGRRHRDPARHGARGVPRRRRRRAADRPGAGAGAVAPDARRVRGLDPGPARRPRPRGPPRARCRPVRHDRLVHRDVPGEAGPGGHRPCGRVRRRPRRRPGGQGRQGAAARRPGQRHGLRPAAPPQHGDRRRARRTARAADRLQLPGPGVQRGHPRGAAGPRLGTGHHAPGPDRRARRGHAGAVGAGDQRRGRR